jgi:hypothetical protein
MTKSPFNGIGYNETVKAIPMPPRVKKLPVSAKGYPVPWFVPWEDGEPLTQAADPRKLKLAIKQNLCWCCGEKLGVYKCFIIGPMCAVNRITSEPPNHRDCAEFAVRACPFLAKPKMKRNPVDDDRKQAPAGIMIERNPGVCLIWATRSYRRFTPAGGGVLFSLDTDPVELAWFREGRTATRAEIMESMDTGFPILMAEAEKQGDAAVVAIKQSYAQALTLIPTA